MFRLFHFFEGHHLSFPMALDAVKQIAKRNGEALQDVDDVECLICAKNNRLIWS